MKREGKHSHILLPCFYSQKTASFICLRSAPTQIYKVLAMIIPQWNPLGVCMGDNQPWYHKIEKKNWVYCKCFSSLRLTIPQENHWSWNKKTIHLFTCYAWQTKLKLVGILLTISSPSKTRTCYNESDYEQKCCLCCQQNNATYEEGNCSWQQTVP